MRSIILTIALFASFAASAMTAGEQAQADLKKARAEQRAAQKAYNESPAGIADARAKAARAKAKAEALRAKAK